MQLLKFMDASRSASDVLGAVELVDAAFNRSEIVMPGGVGPTRHSTSSAPTTRVAERCDQEFRLCSLPRMRTETASVQRSCGCSEHWMTPEYGSSTTARLDGAPTSTVTSSPSTVQLSLDLERAISIASECASCRIQNGTRSVA